eukprot:jgi/Mesvir1/27727/Mv07424-RA.1
MASRLDKLKQKEEESKSSRTKVYLGTQPKKQEEAEDPYKPPLDLDDLTQIATFQNRRNTWFYRDRLNKPRGPCEMTTLKAAWANGVIDEQTVVWGLGLEDWAPIRNVFMLKQNICSPEVNFLTWYKNLALQLSAKKRVVRKASAKK